MGTPHLKGGFQRHPAPVRARVWSEGSHRLHAIENTASANREGSAPIDVFLSAGIEEVAYLHKKGLTLNGAPRIFVQTSLVLLISADFPATMSLEDALHDRTIRLALGDPTTSYLGDVTARALTKVYPMYKSRSHILYASHTEDIVNLIRTGKADVGLVYRANVINSRDVRISDDTPSADVCRLSSAKQSCGPVDHHYAPSQISFPIS